MSDPASTLQILVVDDEPEVRRVLSTMLTREGHHVHESENGRDALRYLDGNAADLVLTDLVMPEMEGLEFIREVLARSPETRIVAMSGVAAGPTYLQAAERFGVTATLQKPFRKAQLLDAIRQALAGD